MTPPARTTRLGVTNRTARGALAGACALLIAASLVVIGVHRNDARPDHREATPASAAAVDNPYLRSRAAAVGELFDRLAAAQRTADPDATRRLVGAGAQPRFLDEQLAVTAAVGGLRLAPASWRYELDKSSAVDGIETPVPVQLADRLAGAGSIDAWVVPVRLRYTLSGAGATSAAQTYVVSQSPDGQWRLVSDEVSLATTGADDSWRGPWQFGPVALHTVRHGSDSAAVVYHPAGAPFAQRVTAALPEAVDVVRSFWGAGVPAEIAVIASQSAAEFQALTLGASGDGTEASATSTTDSAQIGPSGAPVPVGQRLVFAVGAQTRLDDRTLPMVLRHELSHLIARSRTTDGSPQWLVEGVAEFVARAPLSEQLVIAAPDLAAAVARARTAGTLEAIGLPADEAFTVTGADAQLAYQAAWSFCQYIAQRFTPALLRSLYDHLAHGAADAQVQAQAIETVLKVRADDLTAQWRAWLAAQVP